MPLKNMARPLPDGGSSLTEAEGRISHRLDTMQHRLMFDRSGFLDRMLPFRGSR
ncbi:MAG TPA: hypothetical protein PKA20_30300 [Burkholderiaceae bacterium]|nr:hypothetical protein [Burkholderiaceae bacterium]